MKYKVIYEYRGRVTVEVGAETEEAAIESIEGMAEADDMIFTHLSVYNITAKPVNDHYHNGQETDYYTGPDDGRWNNRRGGHTCRN